MPNGTTFFMDGRSFSCRFTEFSLTMVHAFGVPIGIEIEEGFSSGKYHCFIAIELLLRFFIVPYFFYLVRPHFENFTST